MQQRMNATGISVIVPVYNDPAGISNVLEHLARGDPTGLPTEVIVVDNGSTDDTRRVAERFEPRSGISVKVIEERDRQGSYAARNKGLEVASGDLIAFTDSDCTPCSRWLVSGVEPIAKGDADLVGGHVEFTFGDPVTGAELYDSISNMQISYDIARRAVCKTANLFASRSCFDRVGLFPGHLRSGGDVIWTGQATRAGLRHPECS